MEVNPVIDPAERQRQRIRTRTRRRWLYGANSVVATFLLLLLLMMVNYVSSRNYQRWDWSRDQFFRLSEKTLSIVNNLTEPVRIVVFVQPGHELHQLYYEDILQLLREYEHASGNRILVERIDPDRNLARAEELMTRMELEQPNVIIVEQGDRRRVLPVDSLVELDFRPMTEGKLPEKVSFRGEQAITSAILSLTRARQLKVYFLQGHGERDFDDRDEYVGLSSMARMIRRDDIELEGFSFIRRNSIPEDADAIVIAGPTRSYAAGEIDRIAEYVNRAGRLVLLLNSESDAGFGPLLEKWGIESVNNLVVDPTRTLSGYDLLVADYGDHPITERMRDITTVLYWPRALPIRVSGATEHRAVDEPKATVLAQSSVNAWAEVDTGQSPYRFDPERDIKGPVPVAVAIERGGDAVVQQIKPTRVVVFGDVDFISNSGLSGGNADLMMNALNWTLEREPLIAVAARPVEEIKLMMSARQLQALFWTVAVVVPCLMATVGMLVWWRRRQ